MGKLDGRIAIITGAGRGIGREHALLFAREGAKIVVNDLGGSPDGVGADASAAQQVVEEIKALGGEAVASHHDVADEEQAKAMIDLAVETFGDVNVLVNNAGILRDRMVFSMSADEWDAVIRVHLRGHFLPTKFAAMRWREDAKAGKEVKASIVNTTSTSGLLSNPGQTNYGAAKSGIATFTEICQKELGRYGVRSNAIAPAARTRLTMTVPGAEERYAERERKQREAGSDFDKSDPGNISPFVAYLATENCPIAGKVFFVYANEVRLFQPWTMVDTITTEGRWSLDDLEVAAKKWGDVTWDQSLGIS
jgi:NAD(P)-dependent dehydrogenase (short-subunit alcohol dehydrogenase family)